MEPVDFYMNVVFATKWRGNESLGKQIPWEITICNANNLNEIIIITPTPNSLLDIGLVYLKEDYRFPPRYYSSAKCILVDLDFIEVYIEYLTVGLLSYENRTTQLLYSWELPNKTIGVLNENSLNFAEKYFSNVVLLKNDPTPKSVSLSNYLENIEKFLDKKYLFEKLKKKQKKKKITSKKF